MERVRLLGAAVTLAGLAGYVAGVGAGYPGRSLTLPTVMVGLTLVAIGGEV